MQQEIQNQLKRARIEIRFAAMQEICESIKRTFQRIGKMQIAPKP